MEEGFAGFAGTFAGEFATGVSFKGTDEAIRVLQESPAVGVTTTGFGKSRRAVLAAWAGEEFAPEEVTTDTAEEVFALVADEAAGAAVTVGVEATAPAQVLSRLCPLPQLEA